MGEEGVYVEIPHVQDGQIVSGLSLSFNLKTIDDAFPEEGDDFSLKDVDYQHGDLYVCASWGNLSLEYVPSRLLLLYSEKDEHGKVPGLDNRVEVKMSLPLSRFLKTPAALCDLMSVSKPNVYAEAAVPCLGSKEYEVLKKSSERVIRAYDLFDMKKHVAAITSESRNRAFGFLGAYFPSSFRTTTP